MKIRLYIDEDAMDANLVEALRDRGAAVMTAREAGLIEHADSDQLAYATAHQCVLYSFNLNDYMRLHAQYLAEGKSHSGIVIAAQQRYSVGEQMRRLLRLMASKSAEDMINHVEFLSAWAER